MVIELTRKNFREMRWTTVPFGRYKDKTLPEILVRDLDWFFWVLPKLYGRLADEAEDLAGKARAIKIPNPRGRQLVVEYQYEHGNRFSGFMFVDASSWHNPKWSTRLPYLDLCWPRRRKYDKRAGRIMMRDFRFHFFGEHKRLTKQRCEEFFSDDRNFISD
jgi:hypothetical protein